MIHTQNSSLPNNLTMSYCALEVSDIYMAEMLHNGVLWAFPNSAFRHQGGSELDHGHDGT